MKTLKKYDRKVKKKKRKINKKTKMIVGLYSGAPNMQIFFVFNALFMCLDPDKQKES